MKISIRSIFNLEVELLGGKIENVEIKGLINENISFKTKYNLQKLVKRINEEREYYVKSEQELFRSKGAVEEDGKLMIKPLKDGSQNPVIDEIYKEINDLLSQKIEINLNFNVEDFDFKSNSVYPTFMSSAFEEEES
jgi:hypothetical protein